MKRIMILAALAAMLAPAAMAQTVDAIAERAYDLLKAKNYDAAFPLMKQAAEKGDCISMGNLGTMYYKGLGTEIDYAEALKWWGEAEKKGCGDAIKAYRDELMATKSFVVDGVHYIVNPDFTVMIARYSEQDGAKTVFVLESVDYKGRTYRVTSIGDRAFYGCRGLTSVTIGNSVTSIGGSTFKGCSGLTSVDIGNSVTSIGESAFKGCSGLTSVTIPNSATLIGSSAFRDCSGLTSVTIGNSVTSIGESAFKGCSGLTSVHITDIAKWCRIDFGDDCANPLSYAHHLYLNGIEVKNLSIPNTVSEINNNAFKGCSGLTSVDIGNSVTSIGERAFSGCSGLTSVTIPNSVTSVDGSAFSGCSGLTSVTIPNSVTSIGNWAFSGCSGLTSVSIGNSVTEIGESAFFSCSGLASVTIPNSVTSIGKYAFFSCSGLKSVAIGNSVTEIGESAFNFCSGLTSVDIGNSVTSIGESAFRGCSGLTSVTIPNSVTSIGDMAFFYCDGLKQISSHIKDVSKVTVSDAFVGVNGAKCVLKVPAGTAKAYRKTAPWSEFKKIVEDKKL